MSWDWARASCQHPLVDLAEVDHDRLGAARRRARLMPSSSATSKSAMTSAVAMRVLLGTQSVSTAEPPMPSLSTTVTSAPSWAATSAAS